MATWRSGYAAVCKTVYPGSIPGVASKEINHLHPGPLPTGGTSTELALTLAQLGAKPGVDPLGDCIDWARGPHRLARGWR
jgi:hypothetical protein